MKVKIASRDDAKDQDKSSGPSKSKIEWPIRVAHQNGPSEWPVKVAHQSGPTQYLPQWPIKIHKYGRVRSGLAHLSAEGLERHQK